MTGPALAILARCRRLGVAVRADGGRLMFRPASVVPADLKPELLAALTDPAPVPTPGDPEPLDAWIGRYWRPLDPRDPAEAAVLRGRRFNRLKRQGARTDLTSAQNAQKLTTAEKLAREYGVGKSTIRRDGQFAEAVEKTTALDPRDPAEAAVLRGRRFSRLKKARGAPKGNKYAAKQSPQNEDLEGKTALRLAREHGVSRRADPVAPAPRPTPAWHYGGPDGWTVPGWAKELRRRYSRLKKAAYGRAGRAFGADKMPTLKTAERLARERGPSGQFVRMGITAQTLAAQQRTRTG